MKTTVAGFLVLICFATSLVVGQEAAEAPVPAEPPAFQTLVRLMRAGDLKGADIILRDPTVLEMRDASGTTTLMYAAVYMDYRGLDLLLRKGANANATNQAGASALLWAATDLQKIRLLLRHGANVNAASTIGNTPLIVAALQYGSAARLRELLVHGADIKASNDDGVNALIAAAQTGDCEALRVLIQHKADLNHAPAPRPSTHVGGNALMTAALFGHLDAVKLLVNAGAAVNAGSERGSALTWAAFTDRRDCADFLLKNNAQVNVAGIRAHSFRTDSGYTPLMYAAMTERDDPALVEALIKGGAAVNTQSSKDETALMYAKMRGHTRIVETLMRAGARDATPERKPIEIEPLWTKEQLQAPDASVIRRSAEKGLAVMLRSSATFAEETSSRCFSCHQHFLPAIGIGLARKAGLSFDEQLANALIEDFIRPSERRKNQSYEKDLPVPSIPALLLIGLDAAGYKGDLVTDAYVHAVARNQYRDGRWITSVARAPSDYSDVTSTALSLQALQLYAPPTRKKEFAGRVQTAASWLRKYQPKSNEERTMQMLGLRWAGANRSQVASLRKRLLNEQRPDGGWAQLSTLQSDAYATGQALYALHVAGGLPVGDPAYQRGLRFLLQTQSKDGSWKVPTRAFPVQKAVDDVFPYGEDQWSSANGTGWASMALTLGAKGAQSHKPVAKAQ